MTLRLGKEFFFPFPLNKILENLIFLFEGGSQVLTLFVHLFAGQWILSWLLPGRSSGNQVRSSNRASRLENREPGINVFSFFSFF